MVHMSESFLASGLLLAGGSVKQEYEKWRRGVQL